MPVFVRLSFALIVSLFVARAAMAEGDRYADFKSEAPAAAPADWQEPVQPAAPRRRTLPVRFVHRSEAGDGSRVIQAAATESAEPLKLAPPAERRARAIKQPSGESSSRHSISPSPVALIGSLGVVVGLFLIVAWAARRGMPKQPPALPRDVLDVLGRHRVNNKQEVQLMRVGNKLLLVNLMPTAVETLCEITDPAEVDRITGICYQLRSSSSTKNFDRMLRDLASEPARPSRPAALPARGKADHLDLSMLSSLDRRAS